MVDREASLDVPRRVLDAAERLLANGERDATLRVIARRAGVGPGSIYDHYASKEELLASVLARRVVEAADEEAVALAKMTASGALAARSIVRLIVDSRISLARERPYLYPAAAEIHLSGSASRPLRDATEHSLMVIAAALARVRADLGSELEVADAARLIDAAVSGVLVDVVLERPQYLDDPDFATELASVLAASIEEPGRSEPLPVTRARSNLERFTTASSARQRTSSNNQPRRVPRQERSRELVSAIYRGTERVIERSGLAHTTTPNVADAAGVSIGSLYQYFSGRDSVLAGLVDWWIDHDLEKVRSDIRALSSESDEGLLVLGTERCYEQMRRFAPIYRAIWTLLPRLSRLESTRRFLALARREVTQELSRRSPNDPIDWDLSVFVFGSLWVGWVRALIPEAPLLFASAAFLEVQRRAARAVVRRASVAGWDHHARTWSEGL